MYSIIIEYLIVGLWAVIWLTPIFAFIGELFKYIKNKIENRNYAKTCTKCGDPQGWHKIIKGVLTCPPPLKSKSGDNTFLDTLDPEYEGKSKEVCTKCGNFQGFHIITKGVLRCPPSIKPKYRSKVSPWDPPQLPKD